MPSVPQTGTTSGAELLWQQIADATAMDSALKGVLYSKVFDVLSGQHNAFEQFTSGADGRNLSGGVRSIFARKTDLKAGGGDKVKFNVLGPPGGPGARGSQALVGRTSTVAMKTYEATVAFHRDAISFSKDVYEFLSAGKQLESTSLELLSKKMGINKQNHMAMRLIRSANATNTYRPNNRATTGALTASDTLSLDVALSARARLSVLAGNPLNTRVGPNGSPIKGYMLFGTDQAYLPIRNSDAYMTLLSNGTARGTANAMFTGELLDWQGMPLYELPSVDEKWDDYIGSPFLPKAKIAVAVDRTQAVLKGHATNTLPGYFQFFPNSRYSWDGGTGGAAGTDDVSPDSSGEYYAWIVTPAGKVGFVAYEDDFSANSNQLTLKKILSTNTTGINEQSIGNVVARTSGTTGGDGDYTPTVGETNLPTGWTYTDQFPVNSIVIPANANGVPIGYGFVFGAMAGCFAHGRIDKAMIEQEEDFGFVKSRGYEMIFGSCVTTDPFGQACGYLLVEHAVQHEGFAVPEIT